MEKPCEGMKDIDDVLRSVGREAAPAFFQELLANARPAPEYLLDELKAAPEEEKSGYAEEFARIVLKYPPLEQENLRKRMAEALGAGARTVQQIFARVRKKEAKPGATAWQEPKGPATPLTSEKLCFRWGPRGLERVEIGEVEGQRVERSEPVANFIIRIEREAQLIDDLSNEKRYECRVLMRDDGPDSPGRPFMLDAAHFGSGFRLSDALSAAGFYYAHCSAKDMDFLRMASGRYSEERGVLHVKTVRYIGYATGADKEDLGYVSPSVVVRDGKVIPAAEALAKDGLRCEMPTGAFKGVKHLDLAVITDEEFRADLKHIVEELCHLNDVEISRCCLGHAFLAPVFSRLKGFKPYALTLLGDSGHGKTTLATFFQSFFGPGFNEIELESWKSTPLAIERAGHVHKDALYLVDDFKMAHFTTLAKLKEALRILQGYADGAGRNRLTRSSKMMASTFIRGMVLMTGEDFPEGETSNLARLLPVHAAKREVGDELVELRERCNAMRPLHAGVMARFIAWTQQKGATYLQERADEIFKGLVTDPKVASVVADNKTRILQNLALNCLGFVLWAEFAGEAGAFDEAAAQRMVDEHYAFLLSVFRKHVTTVSDERPFVLFLREARAMVESEVVRLAPIVEKPGGGFLLDKEQKGGNRPLVGYQDDRHVYLLQDALFKEVGEYRARGRIIAGEFSKRTIMRQLLQNGVLVPNRSRSGTNNPKAHRISVEGTHKRVMKIELAKFYGETEEEGGGG